MSTMVPNLHISEFLEMGRKLLDGVPFSEVYHKELLDNSNCLLFWKDSESNYLGCNTSFAFAGGCSSPDLIVSKSDYDLSFDEEEICNFRNDDREVLNHKGSKLNIQESVRTPSGKQLLVLTSKFLTYSSNREKIGIAGITSDITEQKILEKNFIQYESTMESKNFYNNAIYGQLDEYINKLKTVLDIIKTISNFNEKYTFSYKNQKIHVSKRELECICLVLQGKNAKQIAFALQLSPRTIESHLNSIKGKFGCFNRNHLAEKLLSLSEFI